MKKTLFIAGAALAALSFFAPLSERRASAAPSPATGGPVETLNPEGINPHAEAPRKRISQKQKQAAADARKKKQAEKAARKAGQASTLSGASNGSENK